MRHDTCKVFGCTRLATRIIRRGELQYGGPDKPVCEECYAFRVKELKDAHDDFQAECEQAMILDQLKRM